MWVGGRQSRSKTVQNQGFSAKIKYFDPKSRILTHICEFGAISQPISMFPGPLESSAGVCFAPLIFVFEKKKARREDGGWHRRQARCKIITVQNH